METERVWDSAEDQHEPLLKITTQSRYCGTAQSNLLPFRLFAGQYLVGATNLKNHIKPDWYLNLKEEPIVQIEIADASFYAKATTPTGNDRLKVMSLLKSIMQYEDKIPRETAAVLLSPLC
ncbi:MAG: nitroreductase/quinone reductase family protein [Pseudomonadales bacterium]